MKNSIASHLCGLLVFASLCGPIAMAQAVRYEGIAIRDNGRLAAHAAVRVCQHNSIGLPCTPLASIFKDPGLTLPIAQPGFRTDGAGNFAFYAPPGQYDIQVSGLGMTSRVLKGRNFYLAQPKPVMNVDDYASCAAAITAAGSSPRLIVLPSTYAGANCASIPANVSILDLRGPAPAWPPYSGAGSVPGGAVIGFNSAQESALQAIGIDDVFDSPSTSAQGLTVTTHVTGTLPAVGTMSAIVGQVDTRGGIAPATNTLTSIEGFTTLNGTGGGTFPLVLGGQFSVNLEPANTSNIANSVAVHCDTGANTSSASVTNAYGCMGAQQTMGAARNYAGFFQTSTAGTNFGTLLLGYNGGAFVDVEDSAGTPRRFLYEDSSGDTNVQMVGGGTKIRFNANDGTVRASISANGLSTSQASIGGGSPISLYQTATDAPGAIVINERSCVDRSVTIPGLTSSAVIMPTAGYGMESNLLLSPGQAMMGTAHYRICNVSNGSVTLNPAAVFNLSVLQ